jgi:hypothetical protein
MDLKNPTRTESLLANIAGYTGVPVPDMKNATRSERLLKEILDNGGGGGGDVTKEYVDNAIAGAVADIDDDISALSDTVADKVDKVSGKSLSTNDYTNADKALVQDSPITTTSTVSPIPTANGKPRKLTIYGKSEVVDGVIKSAGEGWSVVRLADSTWHFYSQYNTFVTNIIGKVNSDPNNYSKGILCDKYLPYNAWWTDSTKPNKTISCASTNSIAIKDTDYTTVADFIASLGDATLCYQLADPTQGNAIAVKTDNGSGIDGTMATFTTGTPLYGINENTRDVMTWDGSAGEATKNCGEVDLGTLNWIRSTSYTNAFYYTTITGIKGNGLTARFTKIANTWASNFGEVANDNEYCFNNEQASEQIYIRCDAYTNATDFKTAMSGVKLVCELATPTTTPLTTAENDSLAGLKTYSPQTTITINDNPDYSIEAYANTANGQAISDMQPTRSPLLTLTASGWTNNAQTVTFAHDVSKRNSIDVEPASIKAWTAAGILATSETASTITFECDTVPTADLSFRVTSMEVR